MAKKKKSKKTKKLTKKITKNMKFSEVIMKYPNTIGVMMKYGLHCVGCQAASFETIQQGAKAHGLTDKQLNAMIDEMNKIIGEKKIEYKTSPIPKEKTLAEVEESKPKKKSFFKRIFGG